VPLRESNSLLPAVGSRERRHQGTARWLRLSARVRMKHARFDLRSGLCAEKAGSAPTAPSKRWPLRRREPSFTCDDFLDVPVRV